MNHVPICHSRDRDEWLAARKRYITASEVSVILGLSPWQTPLQLYLQKLGMMPAVEESEQMYWGSTLEPVIVRELAIRTGRSVMHASEMAADMYASEEYPWLACTIDGQWWDGDDGPYIIEAKTAGSFAASKWDDGVPEMYQLQVQQQMLVMGCERATICALLAGQRYVWCDLYADDHVQDRIIAATQEFYARLDLGMRSLGGEDVDVDPPPPGPADSEALTALCPDVEPDSTVILGQDEIVIDDAIRARNEEIARLKAENEADKNLIRAAMGSAEKGILPGGVGAWTNKPTTRGRVLRRVKG